MGADKAEGIQFNVPTPDTRWGTRNRCALLAQGRPLQAPPTSAPVPAALVGARTAESSGFAVVRFPGGAGRADLFNRRAGVNDGWKSLGSMGKTGRFNKFGAIKKAGVQSAAVSNLALQCVALVVGQVYMTQINSRLESIERGIEETQRSMERADAVRLKASFDALGCLALLHGESISTSESPTVACQTIEDATNTSERDVISFAFNVADALAIEGDEDRAVFCK